MENNSWDNIESLKEKNVESAELSEHMDRITILTKDNITFSITANSRGEMNVEKVNTKLEK